MRERVGIIIWFIFLVVLPFQVRNIVGEWSGEWSSFFFYGTDVALAVLLILTPDWRKTIVSMPGRWFLLAFFILGIVSTVTALDQNLGMFRIVFILKGILLAGSASFWFKSHPALSFAALGISAVIQAIIGFGQFISQSDLGLRILGESILLTSIPGVAEVVRGGVVYLRAYGTTPHPNVLGAVIVTGLFAGWAILPNNWRPKRIQNAGIVLLGSFVVFVLLLTFSRLFLASVVCIIILLLFWVFRTERDSRSFLLKSLGILGVMVAVFLWILWPFWSARIISSSGEQAIFLRTFYANESLEVIKEHPFFGVGPGGGVYALQERLHSFEPWVLQPVHSMYFVIASELGLFALVSFFLFLITIFHRFWHSVLLLSEDYRRYVVVLGVLLLSFLGVGLFEHLFVTLQQGVLLFWVVTGGLVGILSIPSHAEV